MAFARELRDPVGLVVAVLAVVGSIVAGNPVPASVAVGVVVLAVRAVIVVLVVDRRQRPAVPPPPVLIPEVLPPPPPPAPAPAPAVEGNVFRRTGEYWTLAYGGRTLNVKDSKGMRSLHTLLGRPGFEVHVAELALGEARSGESVGARAAAEADLHDHRFSDLGPVLDAKAKAAYGRRLEDLRDQVEEAREWNDPERAARAEAEIDALAHELSRALGLHGHDRPAASEAERLRVNVTRTIRAAIDRIGEHDPVLAGHLTASVRTGRFCSYTPPISDPVSWIL
jgi:hypothetical protein